MLNYPTLARLIAPVNPDVFLRAHWEAKPLRIQADDRRRFGDLLSRDALDRLLSWHNLHHPQISLVDHRRKIDPAEYSYASGLIDSARLYQGYAAGSTVVFQGLEAEHLPLAALCRGLERDMSLRFQTNIYLTPGQAQGFHPHYDSHDVFVLQVEGTKHWLLYDTPVELPFRRQEFDPAQFPCGPVSDEFDLEPGDMLYIPRGLMHDARTVEGQHSLHITIGALFTSWTDLLAEGLAQAGLDDAAFRRALPVGFAREGFDDADAQAHLRALLARLQSAVSLTALLDRFADDFVQSRHPKLDGQFAQLERVKALDVDTRVGARPTVLYRLVPAGDDVSLRVYGSTLTFPARVADALRFAMEHEDYTARDLPCDLDEAGRLVLLRRLVREGLVRIHD